MVAQRYEVHADGAPLRPADLLAMMPDTERRILTEQLPTTFALLVWLTNLASPPKRARAARNRQPPAPATSSTDVALTLEPEQAPAAIEVVRRELVANPTISLAELARRTGLSRSYVCDLRKRIRATAPTKSGK